MYFMSVVSIAVAAPAVLDIVSIGCMSFSTDIVLEATIFAIFVGGDVFDSCGVFGPNSSTVRPEHAAAV